MAKILTGYDNPEGLIFGSTGDIYMQKGLTGVAGIDEGIQWVKESGNGTQTGWKRVFDGTFGAPTYTTADRNAIASPASGMIILNTDTSKLNFWTGGAWEEITSV